MSLYLPIPSQESFCNAGNATAELRNVLAGVCPEECTATQSCGEEWLKPYSEGLCQDSCSSMGVSVYPDTSKLTPYNSVTFGCEQYTFDEPILAEPDLCQVKGSLPQTIVLSGEADSGTDTQPADGSGAEVKGHSKLTFVAFLSGLSFLL